VKTFTPKPADLTHDWYIIDATDVVLGRLATQVATLLRGKNKPTYAPHADSGNHVIIINADKIALTGNKMGKELYSHSGRPGGLRRDSYAELLANKPERIINVNAVLDELIDQSVAMVGKPVALMNKEDKVRAIQFLNQSGAFLVTKSGDKVAKYFGISKYTLYSYIDANKDGDK